MKLKYTIVLVSGILLTFSCNKSTRSVMLPSAPIPVEITPIILPDDHTEESHSDTTLDQDVNYQNWVIQKKSLGPISIGMDIKVADAILSSFNKQNALAEDFGFSGGSPAYIYSINNEQILAILQTLNTKKVYAIIALSEHLKTESEISPKISVEELLKFYPKMKFFLDPMNDWEYSEDLVNQWDFIFITNSKNRIGIYPNPEQSSLPRRIAIKSTWITIR